MGDWKAEHPSGHSFVAPVRSRSLRGNQASLPHPSNRQPRTLTQAKSNSDANRQEDKLDRTHPQSYGHTEVLPSFKYEVYQSTHPRYDNYVDVNEGLMYAVAAELRPEYRHDSLIRGSASSEDDTAYSFSAELSSPLSSASSAKLGDSSSAGSTGARIELPTYKWGTNYDLRATPVRSSPQALSLAGIGPDQSSDFDDVSSNATSCESDDLIDGGACDSERLYTNYLGVPDQWEQGHTSELSEITDAGDQQQLRQKQNLGQSPDAASEVSEQDDLLDSLPPCASGYELQRSIYAALKMTPNSKAKFLPKRQLCRVINIESVTHELEKHLSRYHSSEQIVRYAEQVCTEVGVLRKGREKIKSFRKIFALLVMLDASSTISLFLEEDVSDLDLPLDWNPSTLELRRKRVDGEPSSPPLKFFNTWAPFKLLHFAEYQWIMLAPFFSRGAYGRVKHYILDDQHTLPFITSNEIERDDTDRHGGFAKVFMVRIHKDHHNFADKNHPDRGFAIKQLYNNDRESFMKEVRVLKRFSGARSHPHVVSLLATYEQYNTFHFIFHRAEGDLFRYWSEIQDTPAFDYGNILWVAEQCAGIAAGLQRLHRHLTFTLRRISKGRKASPRSTGNKHVQFVDTGHHRIRSDSIDSNGVKIRPDTPTWGQDRPLSPNEGRPKLFHHSSSFEWVPVERYGRHGDINPGNILWYDNDDTDEGFLKGTLKICDFGQAEFNSLFSKTKTRNVANTLTYRPPECDLAPRVIRQSYDIWCLGCVYLEFVAWVLGGHALLEEFAEERNSYDIFLKVESDIFFKIERNKNTNDPEVMLKDSVTQFIDKLHCHPNCTEYFHELLDMIVNNMLEVKSTKRKSCEEVRKDLFKMDQKCRDDEDYATKKNPWSTHRVTANAAPLPSRVKITEDAKQIIDEQLPLYPRTDDRPDSESQMIGQPGRFVEEDSW